MKFILRLARQARARPQNSPQKAIPSTLLPCTRKRHSKLRKPRPELGQMRLANHTPKAVKSAEKSANVFHYSNDKFMIPLFGRALYIQLWCSHRWYRGTKKCPPAGPALCDLWLNCALRLPYSQFVATQKIAARMISLEIYARIRNQKWSLQWLACMNFSVASHCEGFHRCATAAVVCLIGAQMHFVPTLQSLILKSPKPRLGRPLYALSLFRVINARFSKWKSV